MYTRIIQNCRRALLCRLLLLLRLALLLIAARRYCSSDRGRRDGKEGALRGRTIEQHSRQVPRGHIGGARLVREADRRQTGRAVDRERPHSGARAPRNAGHARPVDTHQWPARFVAGHQPLQRPHLREAVALAARHQQFRVVRSARFCGGARRHEADGANAAVVRELHRRVQRETTCTANENKDCRAYD